MNTTDHLAQAKEYIAKGEDYYRKAAEEIVAAQREDPTLSNRVIGEALGRSEHWVRKIVRWSHNCDDGVAVGPFGGAEEMDKKEARSTRRVLRDADESMVEEIVAALPDDAVENLARAVESRVPAERRSFTTEPRPAREHKPAVDKISQAVFTLWDASEMLLDEAPSDEEKYRLLRLIAKAERVIAGLRDLVDTGNFDDELRALVDEVRAES